MELQLIDRGRRVNKGISPHNRASKEIMHFTCCACVIYVSPSIDKCSFRSVLITRLSSSSPSSSESFADNKAEIRLFWESLTQPMAVNKKFTIQSGAEEHLVFDSNSCVCSHTRRRIFVICRRGFSRRRDFLATSKPGYL